VFKKSFWFSFIPTLVWCFVILLGSFISASEIPSIAVSDKLIHFLFYAIFAVLLYMPIRINTKRAYSFVLTGVIVFLTGFFLGSIIELVQHLVIDGRFGEYLDLLANTLGIVTALLICEILKRKSVL
tara:strand:- start:253 stop:633 length:381 start_codon:yes stop_codon:yes gene_type:complete